MSAEARRPLPHRQRERASGNSRPVLSEVVRSSSASRLGPRTCSGREAGALVLLLAASGPVVLRSAVAALATALLLGGRWLGHGAAALAGVRQGLVDLFDDAAVQLAYSALGRVVRPERVDGVRVEIH